MHYDKDIRTTLRLLPVYHSKDERVRSHVLLCWFSLLLIRIVVVETGQSWPEIRRVMQQQNLVDLCGINGRVLQHTEPTSQQRNILNKLNMKPTKRILKAEMAA